MSTTAERACCTDSGGYWNNGTCENAGSSYQTCVNSSKANGRS